MSWRTGVAGSGAWLKVEDVGRITWVDADSLPSSVALRTRKNSDENKHKNKGKPTIIARPK